MEKTFDPQQIETSLYQHWEQSGYFKPSGTGASYSIVIPPPNVTGTLHMGHGFQNAIMDALIRYHRMRGFNTLWQPGMDHAGIATQMVVERQLLKEGKTRHDLGRDKFIDRVWEWKHESGGKICEQIRRLGSTPDWTREHFTMDERLTEIVSDVFIQLHDEGLIYRGKRLVNWDPKLGTAVSDLEVISQETKGKLWHFRYPLADSDDTLIIATTRPETMLGDTAVAVHPDDERYQHLIGKMIKLPLTDREIPIIADSYVDREFGTGCVKITPAHDFNDYDIGKRHDLPMINILTPDAKINQNAPEKYQGLDRFEARKQVLKDLEALNLLEKIDDHDLKIPRCDRSGEIVEPYLTDQWFVKIAPLAKPAIEAVEKGDIKFIPENWNKTYYQWMNNIEDWCISRQLWWGHRIPAWHDDDGNHYVGKSIEDIREKYNLDASVKLTQDNDVLDTWFSAALWPFVTLGWPDDKAVYDAFFPTSVLVTGFDIIFFWVARMIMFSLKFTGKVPFKDIYITGLIRDHDGQKMSKSKGNVLDPIDLIDGIDLESLIKKRTYGLMQPQMAAKVEKNTRKEFPEGIQGYGTDALRFTFLALASNTRDIRFDVGRLEGYRNFCNKLWNAARFVLMNVEDQDLDFSKPMEFSAADRWITSQLQQTIQKAHDYFSKYRFDFLSQALYEFVWYEYCDWYLELTKAILNDDNASDALKRGTRYTLLSVLEQSLRLLHPLIPFVTESIWKNIAPKLGITGDTIMLEAYPEFKQENVDTESDKAIDWLKQTTVAIRNIRGEMNISPAKKLPVILQKGNGTDRQYAESLAAFLSSLARLESLVWLGDSEKPPASATALHGEMEIHVPMAGLIDKSAELSRLSKEIDKHQNEIDRLKKKLSNESFVGKAPAAVVDKEREKLTGFESAFEKLRQQKQHIESL